MPREIEEAFAACELSLFPAAGRQLASACSCPDSASPCKHVAAVFYLLAEAFDEDPFLVFAWRGRTREELLRNLGALRGAEPRARAAEAAPAAATTPALEEALDRFWDAGPELAEVRARPWAGGEAPDAAVRRLGAMGVTAGGTDLADALAAACRTLAEAARRRALGE
jgi:uncharacterized Zn finger protein